MRAPLFKKMRLLFITIILLVSMQIRAQGLILAHFDAFDGSPKNNSETIAHALKKNLMAQGIEVALCPLQTSFERAYLQFSECLTKFGPQKLILALGETGCKLKAEFVGRNLDKTYGPDNFGVERHNIPINKKAPPYLSLRYPLPQMYCSLPHKLRKKVYISNNAGTFVCNNTAFQMRYHHPEKMIGFIHVPSHSCKGVQKSNIENIKILEEMIIAGLNAEDNGAFLPHETNSEEIPFTKAGLKEAAKSVEEKCFEDFYKGLKAVDSRVLWPF